MRGSAEATRQRIIQASYELFDCQGYARVSVDEIARKSGLTKRTLYYHFRSKDDLLARVLDIHRDLAIIRIHDWSDRLKGDLDTFIDAMFADLATWASQPKWASAGFTRIVMELADMPGHPARAIARHHKAEIEDWMTGQLTTRNVKNAAERAQEIMLLLEGCLSLLLIHGSKKYAGTAAQAAKVLASRS